MSPRHASKSPCLPLGELVEGIFLGLPTSRRPAEGESCPVLSIRDLDGRSTPPVTALSHVRAKPGPATDRYRVNPGDVVMTCRGSQLKVSRVPADGAGALVTSNMIVVRPGTRLLPALVFAFLGSPHVRSQLQRLSRSSAMTLALTTRDVESLLVSVPHMEAQRRVAALIELTEHHYALAQQAAELSRQVVEQVATEVLLGDLVAGSPRER